MRTAGSRIVAVVAVAAAVLAPRAASSQFTAFTRDSRNILEGSWQSCREADGGYSERVYDHVVNGVPRFEVHLGPRREFAVFAGVQDEHRPHDSPDNLLQPFKVELVDGLRASHDWKIPSLNLRFTVTLAGGSRSDCESWFITLAPLDKPTH
jgi:hypothetical protein